jgi:uncharacterized protein YerC
MVNVSKRKLKPHLERAIIEQLIDHVSRTRGKRAKEFLFELLTPAERVQLAKRLTVLVMLMQGCSFTQVQNALKVSPTTVVRLWRNMKNGEYPTTRSLQAWGHTVHDKTTLEAFLVLLTEGLPPRAGKGRWKFLKGI